MCYQALTLCANQQQTHNQYLVELKADFEQRLKENQAEHARLESDRNELDREYQEVQQQLEDDVDQEIEQLRRNYEDKLAAAREATLKYKVCECVPKHGRSLHFW